MNKPGEKQFLKYGEKIILTSTRDNLYLGSRGVDFQAGFYARCRRDYLINKFYLYPNLDELVFEIHPSLNYEALLEYNECSANDPNKEIFHKRMLLEQNLNIAKIEENRSKQVKLGSMVQLHHPNSKTYLAFNSQKMAGSEMGIIGCSEDNSESVQFMITSPFDFLKEGSLVSYEDKFVFSDRYNKTLAYPLNQTELATVRMELEPKVDRGFIRLFDTSKTREFKIPGIIETQKLFEGFQAGYINEKNVSPTTYSNQFEAISIEGYFDDDEPKDNDLKWGDIVNIRKVDSSGKYSLMFSEVNKSSLKNAVLYRYFSSDAANKMTGLESSFQIVHVNLKSSGQRICFDKFNSINVLFKHVLSGKFLSIDPNSGKLILSGDFESHIEELKKNKSKASREYSDSYQAYMKLKETKKFDEITKKDNPLLTQANIDFFQAHGPELFQQESDLFYSYLDKHTFVLEKISSDESLNLNNSTFLKIRTPKQKFLSIQPDETYMQELFEAARRAEESHNFELNFYEAMKGKISHEAVNETEAFEIFHFEKTDKQLVRRFNRLNSYTAFICRMLCVNESKQYLTLQYLNIVKTIQESSEDLIEQKKVTKPAMQMMLVQMSLADLLMDYLIKVKSIVKESEENISLLTDACSATLNLLSLICDNNVPVCTYLFQWRHFFTTSIVKADSQVFKQVNIDSILFEIVDVLKCYNIYIDDYLSSLCQSIRFDQQDMKKIGILLQITKNFQNLADNVSVGKVFEKIFDKHNKDEIFRSMQIDDMETIYYRLGPSSKMFIDTGFQDETSAYEYFLQTLNLAVYLGELDPAKTAKYLQAVYPKDICISIITDNKLPGRLRAVFLKLFALIYVINIFKTNTLISFEELITSKSADFGRQMSDTFRNVEDLKETQENKAFINNLMSNLNNGNNELALASLKIFNLLVGYGFFDEEYVLMIKQSFEMVILIHAKEKRQEEEEKDFKQKGNIKRKVEISSTPKIARAGQIYMEPDMMDNKLQPVVAAGTFRFDDPDTLTEVVDMLMKLHRSYLRAKIINVIKEKKLNEFQQTQLNPSESVDATLQRLFDSNIIKEIEMLTETNEQVWEVLSGWTSFQNSQLTSKILQFIHETSLVKYYFLEKYTEFYKVEDDEDEEIHKIIKAYVKTLSSQLTDLMSEFTTSDYKTLYERTGKLMKEVHGLFDFFFTVMETNDRENKFELAIKENKFFRPREVEDLKFHPVYLNLLNLFIIDCQRIKSKQNILLKSGLLEIVIKLWLCYNKKIFVSVPRLELETVSGSRFKSVTEFETKDPLRDEINEIVLLILYFASLVNLENISFLLNKYGDEICDLILSSLVNPNIILKKTALCLLISLHKNNLPALLKLRQQNKPFFRELLKQAQVEVEAKSYSVLINYVEAFSVLTHYNEAIVEENAKEVFNSLFNDNNTTASVSQLVDKDILQDITKDSSFFQTTKTINLGTTKHGKIFNRELIEHDDMDERNNTFSILEVPNKLLFASSVINILASFGRNCSVDFKNKMQKKLSLNSLIDLVGLSKHNYYLKGQVVGLLNSVFLTTKTDQNSKSYLLELTTTVLLGEVKDYIKHRSNNMNNNNTYFVNRTPRIDFLLFDHALTCPASCFMIQEKSTMQLLCVTRAIFPFLEKFITICTNDANTSIIEAINKKVDELEVEERKSLLESRERFGNSTLFIPKITEDASDYPMSVKASPAPSMRSARKKKTQSHHPRDNSPHNNSIKSKFRTEPVMGRMIMEGITDTLLTEYVSGLTHRLSRLLMNLKQQEDTNHIQEHEVKIRQLLEASNAIQSYLTTEHREEMNRTFFDKLTRVAFFRRTPNLDYKEEQRTRDILKAEVDYDKKAALLVRQDTLSSKQRRQVTREGSFTGMDRNASFKSNEIELSNTVRRRKSVVINGLHIASMDKPQTPEVQRIKRGQARRLSQKIKKGFEKRFKSTVTAEFINLKEVKIGKQILPLEHKKVKPYYNLNGFEKLVKELLSCIGNDKVSAPNQFLVIDYLIYCLESPVLKPAIIFQVHQQQSVRSLLVLLSQSSSDIFKIVTFINRLLRLDSSLQKDFLLQLHSDFDNRYLRTYFKHVDMKFASLMELEDLDTQYMARRSFGSLNLMKKYELDIENSILKESKRFAEVISLPALLCQSSFTSMQHYLRYQAVSGLSRPFQVNIFERFREILKMYLRHLRTHNIIICISMFEVLIQLIQGPCRENQREIVSRRLLGVIEEIQASISLLDDSVSGEEKSLALIKLLRLKKSILEGCSDTLVIKTLSISFNPEVLWSRLDQIYCYLFMLKTDDKAGVQSPLVAIQIVNYFVDRLYMNKSNTIYSPIMQEALLIIMWMNQLAEVDKDIAAKIESSLEDLSEISKNLPRAARFFKEQIRSIEIIDDSLNLQTVFFYLHPMTKYLSSASKRRFEMSIDRKNWSTKLNGLIDGFDELHAEMKHFARMTKYSFLANLSYLKWLKLFTFGLAILLNLCFFLDNDAYREDEGTSSPFRSWSVASGLERFTEVLAYLLLFSNLLVLALWALFEFPIRKSVAAKHALVAYKRDLDIRKKQAGMNLTTRFLAWKKFLYVWEIFIYFLHSSLIIPMIFYVLLCFFGLTLSKFYFSLLLFEVVSISPLIRSVIRSLTLNFTTLGGTAIFGLILMFIYTSLAYYSDNLITNLGTIGNENAVFCDTFPMCYLNMLAFGLKNGGGVGDALVLPDNQRDSRLFVIRSLFDILFFVTTILLLLNIILGIIIDSFAELREERERIENDIENVCFICNLSKDVFLSAEESFTVHNKRTHYMWNYLYFLVGVQEVPDESLSALERSIKRKAQNRDLSFFPLHRTKLLVADSGEDEWTTKRLDLMERKVQFLLDASKSSAGYGIK